VFPKARMEVNNGRPPFCSSGFTLHVLVLSGLGFNFLFINTIVPFHEP
jgi:hypothetical protein